MDDFESISWDQLDIVKFIIWGSAGTALLEVISHPAEIIKTRLQIQRARLDTTSMHMYKNSWDAMLKIVKYEGVRGFWKGYGIKVATLVHENLIYYGSYEITRQFLMNSYKNYYRTDNSILSMASINFISGATAEIVSAAVWMPTDIISQKLQIQGPLKQKAYKNAIDVMVKTYQLEGLKGFYRGIGATLLTYIPSGAFTWMSYEYFKTKMYTLSSKYLPTVPLNEHFVHIMAGAGSGIVCAVVANPFDIAKTRLQVQYIAEPEPIKTSFNSQLNAMQKANYRISNPKYKNTFDVFRAIIKEETVLGFSKGLFPQILFRVPMCALSFTVYEFVKKMSLKPQN